MARTKVATISPTDGQPFDQEARDDILRFYLLEGWTDVQMVQRDTTPVEYDVTADAAVDPYLPA